ncbi:MAG: hypothetical protein ABWY16_06255 [Pedobacter sp.]|uniref:hypothetical protein n=1 Tax=Pedobacter sp. TaxID=1411316 RepID=UPI003399771F
MKALYLIFLAALSLHFRAAGQLVAEDARGESSILLHASSVSFNLSEAALAANWNNFRKLAVEKPKQTIWGIAARGSNAEGLSELFNGGQFTPQSRISGFIGLRKSYQTSAFELLKRIRDIQASADFPSEAAINMVKQLNERVKSARERQPSKALSIYINAGLNTDNFKLYADNSNSTLAARFRTVSFRGAFAAAGLNYEYGPRWTLGLSAGFERYNNLDSLGSSDYRLSNTTTSGNSELSTETKYHAYRGEYIAYNRINFKTDALYFAKLSDDYRLVWNTLYTRLFFPVQENRINKLIQAGTAMNIYKSEGKFAGGLYAQSNDLFNSLHSAERFHERISFGIVAKYAFSSIMSRDFPK